MKKTIFPFIAAAVVWFAISIFWIGISPWSIWREFGKNVVVFLGLWGVSLVNLLSLAKTGSGLGSEMSENKKTVFWGALKFFSLGFLVVLIYLGKSKSLPITLILGVSTSLVVPMVGATIWSFLRMQDA